MATPHTISDYPTQNETLQHFDRTTTVLPWNYRDNRTNTEQIERMEDDEQNLSQNMSYLSASEMDQKLSLSEVITTGINKIPNYLTRENRSFKQMLYQTLSTMKLPAENHDNIEALRKMSISVYKIMLIQVHRSLWMTHLKAGTGQLIDQPQKQPVAYATTLSLWSKEIKTKIADQSSTKIDDRVEENQRCLNFVNSYIQLIDAELKKYQDELSMQTKNFNGYTLTLRQMLEKYIEENFSSVRMEINHKIELVYYDYHIQAMKFEYLRENPNTFQKELMREVCQSKYEQETTEQEVHFLEQQMTYYNSPSQSFECSPLAHCPLIESIENLPVRQHLFEQYKNVVVQARANMYQLYMTTAIQQRNEYRHKYEISYKKMQDTYCSSNDNEKMNINMLDLIDQRCTKISERIKYRLYRPYIHLYMDSTENENYSISSHERRQQRQGRKCHGNRRDQRFRRKCRQKGMKSNEIKKLLHKRHRHMRSNTENRNYVSNKNNDRPPSTTTADQVSTDKNTPVLSVPVTTTTTIIRSDITGTTNENLTKRKRDMSVQDFQMHSATTLSKSISSISIAAQPSLKKTKKTMINIALHMNYRRPMYLRRSSAVLFQMLNKTLNHTFRRKNDREFIYTRINLFDQQYCLEVHQQLWKSYLDLGIEKHRWPSQLQLMAKSDDFQICQQYLINYLERIKTECNKCQIELNAQKQSCLITKVSIEQLDHCLKRFVDCQRQYLFTRNRRVLAKFKDDIPEHDLLQSLSIQHQLTTVQNELVQQLMIARQQAMKVWEEMLMLEIRISYNLLPLSFRQLETFVVSLSYSPVVKEQMVTQFKNKQRKIIQDSKRSWLDIFLHTYDIKLLQNEQQYENKFSDLGKSLYLSNNVSIIDNSSILMNQIQEYVIRQTDRCKQDIDQKMQNFRRKLLKRRQQSSTSKTTVGVSPEAYLDLDENPFNTRQWNQLALGPSFIRLNQSTDRPQDQQKIEIKNQHKEITQKVKKHLTSHPHCVPLASPYFKQYEQDLLIYLDHCYSMPVSYKDQMQSLEQLHIASTIRQTIKQKNLILRVTDKGHNFYVGSAVEFEKKVQTFFQETKAFQELSENPFHQIEDKVIELLNRLRQKKCISKNQYDEMIPDRMKTELAHLYFNPKTHKDGIPIRPIESTIHASTTHISKFLDKLIRPIFDERCQQTNIIDGSSFLNQMLKYTTEKGLFKSTTLFCTFDIRNLYTMLPQEDALNTLVNFLYTHGYRDVQGMSLDTIRKLASIIIKENVFVYGHKIYQQVIGGAMGSSFTLTLANIFMWKWQREIVRQQDITGEFYGRYIDDVFMTWNKSEKDLIELLDQANTWHPNIKLDYKIGQSLPFLDILLTNNNGTLFTSVYHKPAAEPCVVPFQSDHSRHVFINIIQNSLRRALRYSSTFEAFNHERRYIKLMLLYNGYPSSFIETQFRNFFHQFISSTSLLPFITDEKHFHTMRHTALTQSMRRQIQIESTAIQTDIGGVFSANTNRKNTTTSTTMSQSHDEQSNKDNQPERKLFIHHLYEKRFRNMKRGLHQVHKDIFNQSVSKNVKMIVGNRNRRNMTHELIRKRPSKSALINKPHRSQLPGTKVFLET